MSTSVHTCRANHPVRKLKCVRHYSDQCGEWHVFDLGGGFQFRWRSGKTEHVDGCKCVASNAAGSMYKSLSEPKWPEVADVHRVTAAKMYGIPEVEVTQEQRRVGKKANFVGLYGTEVK